MVREISDAHRAWLRSCVTSNRFVALGEDGGDGDRVRTPGVVVVLGRPDGAGAPAVTSDVQPVATQTAITSAQKRPWRRRFEVPGSLLTCPS
jgi:hypothetical protein